MKFFLVISRAKWNLYLKLSTIFFPFLIFSWKAVLYQREIALRILYWDYILPFQSRVHVTRKEYIYGFEIMFKKQYYNYISFNTVYTNFLKWCSTLCCTTGHTFNRVQFKENVGTQEISFQLLRTAKSSLESSQRFVVYPCLH